MPKEHIDFENIPSKYQLIISTSKEIISILISARGNKSEKEPIDILLDKINTIGVGTNKILEERYTSKCSFLDNEEPKKRENYVGKRSTRGTFVAACGYTLNADVNAAYNILLKSDPYAVPLRTAADVGRYVTYPVSWSLVHSWSHFPS